MKTITEGKLKADFVLSLYRKMLEIRMFELKAQELYRRGFFLGILTSSEKAQS